MDFEKTYRSYHPGTTLMWLTGFSKFIFYKLFESVFGYSIKIADGVVYPEKFFFISFAALIPIVTLISILLTFSLLNLNKLLNNKNFIFIFAFILSLEPFYLGVTKLLHLTGLESAFVFASFTCMLLYVFKENHRSIRVFKFNANNYLIYTGLLAGLAGATKMSGFIVLPYLGLMILFKNFFAFKNGTLPFKKAISTSLVEGMLLGLTSILIFYLITPSMWANPIKRIMTMDEQGLENIAFVDGPHRSILKNKALYYYEILFVKTLGLSFIALISSIYLIIKEKNKQFKSIYLFLMLYVVFYFAVMSIPSKQMTRYLTIVYPFILFGTAYTLSFVYERLTRNLRAVSVALIAIYYSIITYMIYPAFSSFTTELIGGYPGYARLSAIYNDGEHYMQVGQYLNQTGGKDAYNYALILPTGNKDVSVPGFLGTPFTNKVRGDKKFQSVFVAVDYYDFEDIPHSCEYIRGFGHRWPLKFDFLSLYKCPGDYVPVKNPVSEKIYPYTD
ncbi:MAG: hypothetical protein E6Q58_00235 [Niabella sp.]|nr:MAG: hypothetical protein E6Q58_00235 [Niabella sp.]